MKRLILILALIATPLWAVQPNEMLDDPALEARAQVLDAKLRCVVCQSEDLASSNAAWASDARILLRDLITDGMSDSEILDFFVVRYGEHVLMEPRRDGANALLWWAGPIMLLLALGIGFSFLRSRIAAKPEQADTLSENEQKRLEQIMRD